MGTTTSAPASVSAVAGSPYPRTAPSAFFFGRKRKRRDDDFREEHNEEVQCLSPCGRPRRPKRRKIDPSLLSSEPRILEVLPAEMLARVSSFLRLGIRAKLAGTCWKLREWDCEHSLFVSSREARVEEIIKDAEAWISSPSVSSSSSTDDDTDASQPDASEENRFASYLEELSGPWGVESLFRLARSAAPMKKTLRFSRGELARRKVASRFLRKVALTWLASDPRASQWASEAYGWIERPDWSGMTADQLVDMHDQEEDGANNEQQHPATPLALRRCMRQELEAAYVLSLLGPSAAPFLWRFVKEGFRCRYQYFRAVMAAL